ncbi:LADA_0E01772g1_1 [Lachancea dasiensis]|uniref:LADA_0E01772g1_1 n=1 Tax=Lachancea dasiensis TaxID=1072105 RepID=A0A1G4JAJ4_9SACH|nr:LADA_0E01772g1_1 [Lachancea dasiensis]
MSRLRKFNNTVLQSVKGGADSDDETPFHPLDTEEQEEFISDLELRNLAANNQLIGFLSVGYVVCCGVFLWLVVNVRSGSKSPIYRRLLLFCVNSIVCSLIALRYEIIKDFKLVGSIKMRVTNHKINAVNSVLLMLISWEASDKVDRLGLQILLHVPLVLFGLSLVSRRWMDDLDSEIGGLRGLKYKFKNV